MIEGNVYKFAALTPAGAELEPKAGVTIVLRATKSVPTPVIDRFNGTSWIPLATLNSGCGNTFELTSTQMGEFAAVGPARPQPPGSGGGIPVAAIVAGLVVLLLVAVVALFSLERARHRAR